LSPFITCRTFVARDIYINGEKAVISAKLHDKLSTNSSNVNVSCHKCTTSDRRWQWSYQLGVCLKKKDLRQPFMKECWSSTLSFRNVDCANWRYSCIVDRTTVYLQ